jgi:small GTP-binding protein
MSTTIALAGNPNAGKTSLFNEITGAMQRVGNWGGVTVDIKEGTKTICGRKVCFVDLPGTYSLSAFSEEERVARNYIVKEKPDAVIDVIDATNLERHLYLTVQLMEMGIRPIVALNMWDEVEQRGIKIDIRQLELLLGLPVVSTNARTGKGVDELVNRALVSTGPGVIHNEKPTLRLPKELENALAVLADKVAPVAQENDPRWCALKLFEHDSEVESQLFAGVGGDSIRDERDRLEAAFDAKIASAQKVASVSECEREEHITALESEKMAAVMGRTWIGRVGKVLEPVVKPFGSDWRGAVSLLTGFVAKEVVVSSMGVLYAVGDDLDEGNDALRGTLRRFFTPLSAFAFMLFVLLYTPCVVALVTVIRELKNWRWSVFSVVYQLLFAWGAATMVYQVGKLVGMK